MEGELDLAGRPYLCMALFCDRVLKEADGVVSVIRVVDRFTVSGNTPEMPKENIRFTALVSLKSGEYRGRAEIELKITSPSGKALPSTRFPINLEGDADRGVGVGSEMQLSVEEEGVYWFDVRFIGLKSAEQLLTRMPLRVAYQRMASASSGSSK